VNHPLQPLQRPLRVGLDAAAHQAPRRGAADGQCGLDEDAACDSATKVCLLHEETDTGPPNEPANKYTPDAQERMMRLRAMAAELPDDADPKPLTIADVRQARSTTVRALPSVRCVAWRPRRCSALQARRGHHGRRVTGVTSEARSRVVPRLRYRSAAPGYTTRSACRARHAPCSCGRAKT
jgi:hypothetical protein